MVDGAREFLSLADLKAYVVLCRLCEPSQCIPTVASAYVSYPCQMVGVNFENVWGRCLLLIVFLRWRARHISWRGTCFPYLAK